MFKRLILLAFLALPELGLAVVHPDCQALGIGRLQILTAATDHADLLPDFCRGKIIPRKMVGVLIQVKSIHGRIAARFGVKPSELFPRPITLQLYPNILGAIDSEVWTDTQTLVRIGVTPGSLKLDESIYIHELGHVISAQKLSYLPGLLPKLNRYSNLLREAFSDALASEFAPVVGPDVDLFQNCVQSIRDSSVDQSFDNPRDFFVQGYSFRKLQTCCDKQVKPTAACKGLREVLKAAPAMDPQDANRFDADFYQGEFARVDRHQIGVPVHSFFRALARLTNGKTALQVLLDALDLHESTAVTRKFFCNARRLDDAIEPLSATLISISDFLLSLKAFMPAQATTVEALWRKAAMDKAVEIGQIDPVRFLEKEMEEPFQMKLTNAAENRMMIPLLQQTACWDKKMRAIDRTREGCDLTCRVAE